MQNAHPPSCLISYILIISDFVHKSIVLFWLSNVVASSQPENIIRQTGTKTIWCLYLSIDIRNRKSVIALQKPTYYLWRTDYTSSEDFEADKEKYRKIGFRVVTFADGQPDKNIHNGIKALIRNHIKEINQ